MQGLAVFWASRRTNPASQVAGGCEETGLEKPGNLSPAKDDKPKPGRVVHAFDPSTQEAEAGNLVS